jgi:RNA polymerase-binding transcription factor DksA
MLNVGAIRTRLETRRAELNEKIVELREDLRGKADPNFSEQAIEAEDDEVLEGLENQALAEVDQIQSALSRIEQGVYGNCASCEEPIDEKRLDALPYATQCIKCAS